MQSPAFAIGYGIWARNQKGYMLARRAGGDGRRCIRLLFACTAARAGTLIASTIPLVGIFAYVLNSAIFAQEPGSLCFELSAAHAGAAGQEPHAGFLADALRLVDWRWFPGSSPPR